MIRSFNFKVSYFIYLKNIYLFTIIPQKKFSHSAEVICVLYVMIIGPINNKKKENNYKCYLHKYAIFYNFKNMQSNCMKSVSNDENIYTDSLNNFYKNGEKYP